MSTLWQRITTNWHFVRIFRTGIGLMMAIMAIQNKDWAIGLFGIFFLYQGVTDTGCCGSGACYNPPTRSNINPGPEHVETVDYEEI